MSLRNISHWEFEQLLPEPPVIEAALGEQVEWWTNRAGRILGTIAKGVAEPGWRYLLLERDPAGHFHVCRLQHGIESLPAATRQLIDAMEIIDPGDEKIAFQESVVVADKCRIETNRHSEKE